MSFIQSTATLFLRLCTLILPNHTYTLTRIIPFVFCPTITTTVLRNLLGEADVSPTIAIIAERTGIYNHAHPRVQYAFPDFLLDVPALGF